MPLLKETLMHVEVQSPKGTGMVHVSNPLMFCTVLSVAQEVSYCKVVVAVYP